MIVTVKDIEVNSQIDDAYHGDSFSSSMVYLIGKKIKVRKDDGDWYRGIEVGFNWHKSWLIFNEVSKKQIIANEDGSIDNK